MEGMPRKSTSGLQKFVANTKLTTCWIFIVLPNSHFHTEVKKKWRPFWIFPLKSANGEPKTLIFSTEAELNLAPALLKCQCLQVPLHADRTLWTCCKFMFGITGDNFSTCAKSGQIFQRYALTQVKKTYHRCNHWFHKVGSNRRSKSKKTPG